MTKTELKAQALDIIDSIMEEQDAFQREKARMEAELSRMQSRMKVRIEDLQQELQAVRIKIEQAE